MQIIVYLGIYTMIKWYLRIYGGLERIYSRLALTEYIQSYIVGEENIKVIWDI